MPLVSVIIPTYNRSLRVREAVRSVLAQTWRDFELIVVDDGSTDGTASALGPLGGRVRLVSQPHAGVSAARNRGVRLSGGAFIAFLDSDDLWLPKKLEAQAAFFDTHPDMDICQTEEIWLRNGKRVNPRVAHRKQEGDIFRVSLDRCMVSPSAVMIRRSLLEEVGLFDTGMEACEDYDLWLRITCRHPVGLIPEPLIVKRGGHPDQLSRSVPALDRFRIRALCKILSTGSLSREQRTWAMEVLRGKALIYTQGCIKRGKVEEADRVREVLAEIETRGDPGMRSGDKEGTLSEQKISSRFP